MFALHLRDYPNMFCGTYFENTDNEVGAMDADIKVFPDFAFQIA